MRRRNILLIAGLCICMVLIGCDKETIYDVPATGDMILAGEAEDMVLQQGSVTIADETLVSSENASYGELGMQEAQEAFAPDITAPSYAVSIMAVGDNLYHTKVWEQGWDGEFFDFVDVYEEMSSFIGVHDIAIVNQETPLVNGDYSSYPMFGTPSEVITALDAAGFDVVTCATNHSNDKGTMGIQSTITAIESMTDMSYVGINKYQSDYDNVFVKEVNGIKIAFLNYTYGLNGLELSPTETYLVNTLYDRDKIISDLQEAENLADFTIVFPHWGTEYVYNETQSQTDWAKLFVEYGADLIIGTHPHVCEPVKWVTSDNGNSALCYYSLGNYVSGQNEYPRLLGGIASLNIIKDESGVRIDEAEFLASLTYQTKGCVKPIFLKDYTDDMASEATLKVSKEDYIALWEQINENTEIEYENFR